MEMAKSSLIIVIQKIKGGIMDFIDIFFITTDRSIDLFNKVDHRDEFKLILASTCI